MPPARLVSFRRRVARGTGCLAVALGALVIAWAPAASAHAFLAQSSPPAGARLSSAPSRVELAFTERVARATIRLTRSGGGTVVQLRLSARPSTVVRADVPPIGPGIYVVDWQVTSADDGHETDGEFAFAIGTAIGRLPSSSTSTSTDRVGAGIALAVFAGLATAGGTVLTALAVDHRDIGALATARAGFLLGIAAVSVAYLRAVSTVSADQRPALAAGLSALAFSLGLALTGLRRVPRRLALGTVVAAAAAWSARGHAAALHGMGAEAVDTVHLLAATLWAGCLGVLAWRVTRSGADRAAVAGSTRAYARLALVLVTVLAVAGGISALQLLGSVSDLWRTGYGRLLMTKSVFFAIALALAGVSRWLGLRGNRAGLVRRLLPWEAGAVAVVFALAALLISTAPPVGATATGGDLLGPPPLPGLVSRSAGLAGELTVGVAAGDGQIQVQVWDPNHDHPRAHLSLDATIPDGRQVSLSPRKCGRGCVSQAFALPAGITRLSVHVRAPGWSGGTFSTTVASPPGAPALGLLRRVAAHMRAIVHVQVTERVTSGPGETAPPTTFTLSGAELAANEPWGGGVADEAVVPPGGDSLEFYLAGEPLWAGLTLDSQGRITSERLVDVGHVVTHELSYPTG